MKILITGADGLLGKAATQYLSPQHQVIPLKKIDLDITNAAKLEDIIKAQRPALLINCAAMARVDLCETELEQAWAINAWAVGQMATIAAHYDMALMHISTDYVFDGEKRTPYTIEDRPHPISKYGQSKWEGELAISATNAKYYIVRVARLFGLLGNNFGSRIFQLLRDAQINNRKLKVVDHPYSQATYLPHLLVRLQEIFERGEVGIYQVTSSGPILSWVEFTQLAIEMMGLSEDLIEPVSYEALGLPARRPYYSALRCLLSERLNFMPLPDWREGLKEIYQQQSL